MIKTAVILAAGLGSRLGDLTRQKPKGFLELEGRALIKRSIEALRSHGIERILIGTGYLSEFYEQLASKCGSVQTVKNTEFQTSGSMMTLYNMKDALDEDFLLLESDLLYENAALDFLLSDERANVILASGATHSDDEVYIENTASGVLVAMSKKALDLKEICGELVGISKISAAQYKIMCDEFIARQNKNLDYETLMSAVSAKSPFFVKKIEDLTWCEIDDKTHLNRALTKILPTIKAKTMKIKRNVLLNPGPATTTDSVKMAQVVPDICPREREFGDVMEFISNGLTSIVANTASYTSVLFGGSGTAGVEAVLTSVIPDGKCALIINNGAYGKRMCQIAARYKIDYDEFTGSQIAPINMAELEARVKANPRISHLCVIHNETTTGLLSDLNAFGKLAGENNIELVVDAMSSYAALPINMEAQNISYLVASSNKNIQAMAGVSFVIARKKSIEKLKDITPRSFYLSLYEQYEHFIKTHQMRFTPPVQTLYALKQAIIEAQAEGIENRYKRYSVSWETLTKGLRDLGLEYLVDDAHHSRIITSIHIPSGVDFNKMHDFFYERGFTIYPGKVAEFNTFRIANIGEINANDIQNFLDLLREFLGKA
ncbi:MAG: 2-aminoethylphosphonate aminotransferase [Helicobacteraceae bacterium]